MGARRATLAVALAVAGLTMTAAPSVAAKPAVRTVRAYLAQEGTCGPTSWGYVPSRKLVTGTDTESQPCPRHAFAPSLREDEHYALADIVVGKFLPQYSEVVGELVFEQKVEDVALPGYVDADITVALNGHRVATRVTGIVSAAEPYKAAVRLEVPDAVRNRPVTSLALDIHWNAGTTPRIEPRFAGSSFFAVSVYTPRPLVTARFDVTMPHRLAATPCPTGSPGGSVCLDVSSHANIPHIGRVQINRTAVRQTGTACSPAQTVGTLTLPRKGVLTVAGSGVWCPNDGSTRYRFGVTGGSGIFSGAVGSGLITVPPAAKGAKDVWTGSITYMP